MTAAKRRAIDLLRRESLAARKVEQLGYETAVLQSDDLGMDLDDDIGDDLLRLVFTACHPVLPPESRVALTLRVLGGLSTPEIARAFLVPEATVAQRIVRAKRTLAEKQVPFGVPRGAELAPRLASVLEVVYLIFNEAMPLRPVRTGCVQPCVNRRCDWVACWYHWHRASQKRLACWH